MHLILKINILRRVFHTEDVGKKGPIDLTNLEVWIMFRGLVRECLIRKG